ncbi:MAG: hypothetical protein K6A65_08010, partial [Succinivibrionaceae bacterium]|nr:hypothetical protein [Succinivibrionaceae bacterium]
PGTCSVYEVGGTCEERPGDQECIVNMSFYSRPDVCVHISDPASCQEISRIRGRHCTLAAELHRQKPRLRIHTILIGEGLGQLSCISSATGGSVQEPRDAAELVKGLLEAGTSLREICEE